MRMLSTGVPSTLGNWYDLCKVTFGEESMATLFIKEKMDESGRDEEVLTDESQLLHVLGRMYIKERKGLQPWRSF